MLRSPLECNARIAAAAMIANSVNGLKEARTIELTGHTTAGRTRHCRLANQGRSTQSKRRTRTSAVYDLTCPEYTIAVSHTVKAAPSSSDTDTAYPNLRSTRYRAGGP